MTPQEFIQKLSEAFGGQFKHLSDARFLEGRFVCVPDGWLPSQLAEFQAYFEVATGRKDIVFLPAGFVEVSGAATDITERLEKLESWVAAVRRGDVRI